jgi:hypothetical protein
MTDKVLTAFLERQREDGMALAAASDLLDLAPLEPAPCQRYLAGFRCTGLIRGEAGGVTTADRFLVGIWFPDQYLREADPSRVLAWIAPQQVFHPNVRPPFICVGHLAPGTPLVDLLYRCFEIITWNRVTMREDDALDRDACRWARNNQDRLPVDRRPLKRRRVELGVEPLEVNR